MTNENEEPPSTNPAGTGCKVLRRRQQTIPNPLSSSTSTHAQDVPRQPRLEELEENGEQSQQSLRDWILLYFEGANRFAGLLQDNLATIEKRCVRVDIPKLGVNNSRTRILADGLVKQIHSTIQKHIEGLEDFDAKMCRQFVSRYPPIPLRENVSNSGQNMLLKNNTNNTVVKIKVDEILNGNVVGNLGNLHSSSHALKANDLMDMDIEEEILELGCSHLGSTTERNFKYSQKNDLIVPDPDSDTEEEVLDVDKLERREPIDEVNAIAATATSDVGSDEEENTLEENQVGISKSDSKDNSTGKVNEVGEPKPTGSLGNSGTDSDATTIVEVKTEVRPAKSENQSEESDGNDSDFIPTKKLRLSTRPVKLLLNTSDSSNSEDDVNAKNKNKSSSKKTDINDSSGDNSDERQKSKNLGRRAIPNLMVKKRSSEDEVTQIEESQGPSSQCRKNIRKVIDDQELQTTTRVAAREEQARKQRLLEKQKLYNQIFKAPESDKLDSLVLDFDKKTKSALVSVDPAIAVKLKSHQASGIQFMWDACFESLENKKKGGCILAHCMGLGKTLQCVALMHTLVNNNRTGVKTILVLCPLNTVTNWNAECLKWTSGATGRLIIHRLWDDKGESKYSGLREWQKKGGVGILHYEAFRNLVNSSTKKGKQRVRSKHLNTIEETLLKPGPDLVICDEGHLLKNVKSKIKIAVAQIATLRRILLTGTPLQNNLNEYHTMMTFVKPNLLGNIKEFRNRFVNPIKNGQLKDSSPGDVNLMKKRAHVLHKLLEGCVQRLDFRVLAPLLPPKFEYAISISLSEKQKDLYDHYINHLAGNTHSQRETFVASKLFSDYAILTKICTHPITLTYKRKNEPNPNPDNASTTSVVSSLKDFVDEEDHTGAESDAEQGVTGKIEEDKIEIVPQEDTNAPEVPVEPEVLDDPLFSVEALICEEGSKQLEADWYNKYFESVEEMKKFDLSGKFMVLIEILKVAESVGDKVLIFSQFLTTLDLIEEVLANLDKEGLEADRVRKAQYGNTIKNFPPPPSSSEGRYRPQVDYFRIDGSTKTEIRQLQCDRFNQENHRAKLFLISIRAGGLGINLVGANRVIIFDASWNPSQDLQSIFRVYRFGQTKPSYIYRLLSRGTMEEKIYNRQVVKLSLSCRVIDEQQIARHYHYDDLQKMYQFDRNDTTERPTPIIPKDKLLAELLQSHKDWIFSYLEHDSLLENKEEEELSEDAKQIAWDEYNINIEERRIPATATQSVSQFLSNIPILTDNIPVLTSQTPGPSSFIPTKTTQILKQSTLSAFTQPQIPGQTAQIPRQTQIPGQTAQIPRQTQIPGQTAQIPRQTHIPGQTAQIPRQTHIPGQTAQIPRQTHIPGQSPQTPRSYSSDQNEKL